MKKTENLTEEQKKIINDFIKITTKKSKKHEFKPSDKLLDIGLDDLDFVEVVMEIEKTLKISIDDSVMGFITTVQELYNAVYNSLLESTNKS